MLSIIPQIPDFLDSERVLYRCTCGQLKTIHRIYFCRYCNEIRCRDCISHEVYIYLSTLLFFFQLYYLIYIYFFS